LLLAVPLVMAFGYLVSYGLGKWISPDRKTQIAIAYSGGVRNYTVGMVIAAAFFPPAAGIPVLLAMLFQHPMALLFYYVFRWTEGKQAPSSLRSSSLSRFGG
jgi:predicted Na+-dependent transporter